MSWWPVIRALAGRPDLWPSAAGASWSLAGRGWWRRWPFLPLPDPRWLRFRLVTAYGDGGAVPPPADVVTWLEWRRDLPRPH